MAARSRSASGGVAALKRSAKPASAAQRVAAPQAAAPVPATPSSLVITHEMIARRAYQIWQSGRGGSAEQNWAQAERELRGQR